MGDECNNVNFFKVVCVYSNVCVRLGGMCVGWVQDRVPDHGKKGPWCRFTLGFVLLIGIASTVLLCQSLAALLQM